MTTADEYLKELQGAEIAMGRAKLRTLVAKHHASLARLPRFKDEVEAQLALDDAVDFEALVADLEPALAQATEFLLAIDLAPVDYPDQDELPQYGQSLAQIATTRTIKALAAKFYQRSVAVEQEKAEQVAAEKKAKADEVATECKRKADAETLENKAKAAARAVENKAKADAAAAAQSVQAAAQAAQARSDALGMYVEHGDGTVTDTKTKLMWKQCAEGQQGPGCTGRALLYPWDAAMKIPRKVNLWDGFAGHHDWRLPTQEELRTLTSGHHPALCLDVFPNSYRGRFWSSAKDGDSLAWSVDFNGDSVYAPSPRSSSYAVRLVRASQ